MVNVIDINGGKLNPCTEAKAMHLLNDKKAEIVERVPFTIRLNFAVDSIVTPDSELTPPAEAVSATEEEQPAASESTETSPKTLVMSGKTVVLNDKTVEIDGETIPIPQTRFYVNDPYRFAKDLLETRKAYSKSIFSCKPSDYENRKAYIPLFKDSIRGRRFTVGKTVEFGSIPEKLDLPEKEQPSKYPYQWKDGYAGQPIKWRILDIDHTNNKILLLSDKILFGATRNNKYKRRLEGVENEFAYRWTESDICMYLNTDFLKEFSLDKLPIANICHKTEAGWFYETEPAEYSDEKVFLLSREEVERYLPEDKDRVAIKIDKTFEENRKNRIASGTAFGNCKYFGDYWYLRTPGNKYDPERMTTEFVMKEFKASGPTIVGGEGEIISDYSLRILHLGIRPAMWLRIV